MILLIQYTIIFASVLALTALGGCFSEHSGVINLGLEGVMVIGALGGALTLKALGGAPAPAVFLAILAVAALSGLLYSALLGVGCVNFRADQTLVGTAMNILATAAASVIAKSINTAANPNDVSTTVQYTAGRRALSVSIGGFEFNWFMLVAFAAIVIAWIVLYRTRFGLRLMACGENPQAADSVGIPVLKMRWAGVLISGILGGIGGIAYITAGVSESLAVMIFGQWKPTGIAGAALLFGFFRALSSVYSGIGFLSALHIPGTVYNILPYAISLLILAFTSERSLAPKAEGIPYDKSRR